MSKETMTRQEMFECKANIKRMTDAHTLLGESRKWLDKVSMHNEGDMSLRLNMYEAC